ncbi:hypothetical protein [Sphingomonas sp. PAMC 26605]|uniref:hypothetical protein n=1 Tax=Sphingomonas sp. PAMC 26605 TaxID=1112214 RepID=UPI00026CB0EE|nr:hypothetical protein [Sphingomonas sp. PAMC 26605]
MADKIEDAPASDVKVRVLLKHKDHLPNHVITLSAAAAKVAVKAGWADDDADGVAYAEANELQPEAGA